MVARRKDRPRRLAKAAKQILTKAHQRTQKIREAACPTTATAATATAAPAPAPATAPTGSAAPGMSHPRPNLPRLHFEGKFYTDPSTTNNYVNNYDVEKFRPNYQLRNDDLNFNGSWNPAGTATFALVDCAVTAAYSPALDTAAAGLNDQEALIGQPIEYNRRSVYGKISDLDPQLQTVSTLYGVRVNVGTPAADGAPAGTSDGFTSLLAPTAFRDMWGCVYNPDAAGAAYIRGYGAVYQGLLGLEAFSTADSTFLQECQQYVDAAAAAADPAYPKGALSIRFRVDWYCNDPTDEDFCYGNVTGYITPWLPGYPLNFDLGRQLYTTDESNGHGELNPDGSDEIALANMAYAAVVANGAKKFLFLDLGNSLYRLAPTGTLVPPVNEGDPPEWTSPYQDQGTLEVGYFSAGTYTPGFDNSRATFTQIAEVDYHSHAFELASGVLNIELLDTVAADIADKQLCLRATTTAGSKYLLAEADDGFFTRADSYVFHLQGAADAVSAATHSAKIYCSLWGVPQTGQTIVVGFDSSGMQNDGQNISPSGPGVGTPVTALQLNDAPITESDADAYFTTVTTGDGGFATLSMQGLDCGNPRGYIDGQLYGLRYAAGAGKEDLPVKNEFAPNNEKINILLFDVFNGPVNKPASWLVDVLPIFKLYANLYPSMDRIVRLDDYGSVVSRKDGLVRVFTSDENDPMYMPTTRDLSTAKREMIVDWLQSDDMPFMNQTVEDVHAALQTIIELEHSTMPPYLTALFTIKRGYNEYIADTLRDVAEQEMLHMAIACNILTAIGGTPNISKIGFVPKFPGPLPGGLRPGLIMRLRKASVEQFKSFVAVEAPDEQYLLEDGESSMGNPKQKNKYTIGWVYDALQAALEALTDSGDITWPGLEATDDDPRVGLQVDGAFDGKLKKIKTLVQAKQAIAMIKEEGEGSSGDNDPSEGTTDPDTGLPQLAHYFRFNEIVKGRRLTVGSDADGSTYAYNGPRIEIDEEGVYDMQDDPRIEKQPLGSQQRERMESFALKYQALLNGLQIAFTKDPGHLRECFGLMFQLTIAAQPLMEMPALNEDGTEMAGGKRCGVSFQVPITETGP